MYIKKNYIKVIYLAMAMQFTACGGGSDTPSKTPNATPNNNRVNQDILSNGLIAHYKFEENTNDSSIHVNNGIAYGGLNYTDGVIGKACVFDGVDDYINTPDNDTLDDTDYLSISVWVNFNSFYANGTYVQAVIPIVGKSYSSDVYGKNSYGLSLNSDTKDLSFSVYDQSNNIARILGPTDMALNTWNHVVATFDKGTLSLYLNGILLTKEETAVTHIGNSTNNLQIADWFYQHSRSYSTRYTTLNGMLDELRIYNRTLDKSEIEKLYTLK